MRTYLLKGSPKTDYELSGMRAHGGERLILADEIAAKHTDVLISTDGKALPLPAVAKADAHALPKVAEKHKKVKK